MALDIGESAVRNRVRRDCFTSVGTYVKRTGMHRPMPGGQEATRQSIHFLLSSPEDSEFRSARQQTREPPAAHDARPMQERKQRHVRGWGCGSGRSEPNSRGAAAA